ETSTTDRIEKDQPECSVASSSKSTNISVTPKIKYVESLDDKLETPEIVEELEIQGYTLSVENEPEISTNSSVENDKPESSNELGSYAEELASKLSDSKTKEQAQKARDQAKRCFQELGLSKEQGDTLIPIRAPGRHVVEKDPIKVIAQDIIKNNLSPEEINGIAYVLASSAPTTVARNSRLNLLRKKLRKLGANYLITEAAKILFVTEEANQIQHLSLNSCICFTNRCITEITRSYPKLRHIELGNCSIGNKAIKEIAHNCTNLKYLSLKGCKGISKEVIKKLNPKIKIEYPDYSDEKWSDPPILIFRGPSLDRTNLISTINNYIRETESLWGVIGVLVGNLYGDVIGKIKCLDLQFQYKGKWRSLDGTK
ncbi:45020_t:CDS:2, partial [Gigaspora margarita]